MTDEITPTPSPLDEQPPGLCTAEQIAARLAALTSKKRVPASTIRAMSSRGQMPAPVQQRWRRRALWDVEEIERWLSERESREVPRDLVRRIQRRLSALDEAAHRSGNDARLKQGVRDARRRGLSFQQIADAITTKDGHHPTREAVRTRFRPYL
ncbi:helix-turn-helix transcriptional regulator [Gephyromycinifex aptenodytis]|uniref:helix-turn-helix transcriptional regulator n=1 Tax=Gephyromycinifex aptenodytis TaxID=2716227 RepID=UPI0014485C33|nr:hypothetical protein [Gephyromycinifex aptenodytis]